MIESVRWANFGEGVRWVQVCVGWWTTVPAHKATSENATSIDVGTEKGPQLITVTC
jgi:hypothetical protein